MILLSKIETWSLVNGFLLECLMSSFAGMRMFAREKGKEMNTRTTSTNGQIRGRMLLLARMVWLAFLLFSSISSYLASISCNRSSGARQ
jgi:hypothetical protein